MVKLTGEEILNTRGYHAAETVILNNFETFQHTHEFYELFITIEGEVYHHCNQQKTLLFQNSLCLVKPEDVHCFRKGQCKSVHFMNLAFSREIYEKAQYIWREFYGGLPEKMEDYVNIPGNLSQSTASRILYLMKCMVHEGEIPGDKIILGILLDSFTFLQNQKANREIIPGWLESVCHKMQRTENYQIGLERFVELSDKSQEYLNRVMKKYYGMTTTAYLNAIRLEEAAFLLRTTDESVLNIMLECGFNNVSYFNQRFKEGYGITPTRYRQFNRLAVNPV